jgi:hypothetical protein
MRLAVGIAYEAVFRRQGGKRLLADALMRSLRAVE